MYIKHDSNECDNQASMNVMITPMRQRQRTQAVLNDWVVMPEGVLVPLELTTEALEQVVVVYELRVTAEAEHVTFLLVEPDATQVMGFWSSPK